MAIGYLTLSRNSAGANSSWSGYESGYGEVRYTTPTWGGQAVTVTVPAEMQGATGVVVNAPTANEVIRELHDTIDIPIVVTAFSAEGIAERIENGAAIINVAAGAKTPDVVAELRAQFKDLPIIATGGPTDVSLTKTISAGANAIVWTPPSPGDVFKEIMTAYRNGEAHP